MKTILAKGALTKGVGILVLVAGCSTAALAQQMPGKPDVMQGEEVARRVCAVCHIPEAGAPRLQGTADIPTFPEIARRPGQTAERIHGILVMPTHPMPTIPLTQNEMVDLAAYILSLK